jgi:hypothetical protein
MKGLYFAVVFFVCWGLCAFADTGDQEEVDFLLFLPNSAEEFVDQGRAMVQLDNMAKYLLGKNPNPGQIHIYGYTANVENDIDSIGLSKGRALLVMDELRKRGVSRELFSDPVAYGPVDLWGDNINEEDRIPNRRVRVVFEGAVLTPAVLEPVESAVEPVEPTEETVEPPVIIITANDGDTVSRENTKGKSRSKLPWIILLLLFFFAVLPFLLSLLKKRKRKRVKPATAAEDQLSPLTAASPPPIIPIIPAIIPATEDTSVTTSEMVVNLDEEIRFRAYELYLLRYGRNEDEINDWYRAVMEVCGRYDASGYQTYEAGGSWWAKKTIVLHNKPAQ